MATKSAVTVAEGIHTSWQVVSHELLVMADAREMLARHMCWRTGIACIDRGSSGGRTQQVT